MQDHKEPLQSELCYLDASKVASPVGVLADLDLLSAGGESLGHIEGVVIETAEQRIRYYDVKAEGRRRYLVPADQLAQVETNRKALRLRDHAELHEITDVDPTALRTFSGEEMITGIFGPRAA